MTKSEYAIKLKDPRWQKKRLEILERDSFSCQKCFDGESTLHIHHRRYLDGDPWDIPDTALITLCEKCHEEETDSIKEAMASLTDIVRDHFFASDIITLAWSIHSIGTNVRYNSAISAEALAFALSDKAFIEYMQESYIRSKIDLNEKRKSTKKKRG